MQKDFMAMAQGQAAPPEQAIQEVQQEVGLPTGSTPEDAKQRMLIVLEEAGVLAQMTQEGLKDVMKQIDEYIKLAMDRNFEALQKHPLTKILQKIEQQPTGGAVPQAPGAAPKDFASMMPGGGMGGR